MKKLFHIFHNKFTAIARYRYNNQDFVVLKCDSCSKFEILTMSMMQYLRHMFVIDVDVSNIDMCYSK